MLRPRVIPCLLIHNNGLAKTELFKNPKYVGDPLNAVRIFNEKQVDEIMIADIDASVSQKDPDYKLIGSLASECRMPMCYVGGVKTADQVEKIVSLGVEKVGISSGAIHDINVIRDASNRVGSQSVVGVLDICKEDNRYLLKIHNGTSSVDKDPMDHAKELLELGIGEIVINAIHRDGLRTGFDLALIKKFRENFKIPITALGGAGTISHFHDVINSVGNIGLAAGSLFVFKGKFKAVLINYLDETSKEELYNLLKNYT